MKPNLCISKAHDQEEQKPIWLNGMNSLSPKRFSLTNQNNSSTRNDNKAQLTGILCDALLTNSKDREIRSYYKQIIHEYYQRHPNKLTFHKKRNRDAISMTKEDIVEVFGEDSIEENYYMKVQLLFDFITSHDINRTKCPKKAQQSKKSEPPSGRDSQNSEDSFTLENVQNDKTNNEILQEKNGDKIIDSFSQGQIVETTQHLCTTKENMRENAIIQPKNQNNIENEIKNLLNLIYQHQSELLSKLVAINKGSISFLLKSSEQFISNECSHVLFRIQSTNPNSSKYTTYICNVYHAHVDFLAELLILSKEGMKTFRKQISEMLKNNPLQKNSLIQNTTKPQIINSNLVESDRKEEVISQVHINESPSDDLKPENQVLITKYFKICSKPAESQNNHENSLKSELDIITESKTNPEKEDEVKFDQKTTLNSVNEDKDNCIKICDESETIIPKNEDKDNCIKICDVSETIIPKNEVKNSDEKISQEIEAEINQEHKKNKEQLSTQSEEKQINDESPEENEQNKMSSYYKKLKLMKEYHENKKIKLSISTSKSVEKLSDISRGQIKECPNSYFLERIKKNEPKTLMSHSISQEKVKLPSFNEERKSFMNIASNYTKTHQNFPKSQQNQRVSSFSKECKVPAFFKKIQEIHNGKTEETVVIQGNQSILDRLTKNILESKNEAIHQEKSDFQAKDFVCSQSFVPFQPK